MDLSQTSNWCTLARCQVSHELAKLIANGPNLFLVDWLIVDPEHSQEIDAFIFV